MSTAAIIPRTEHPDYLAARAAYDAVRDRCEQVHTDRAQLAYAIARRAVEDDLPSAEAAQQFRVADAAVLASGSERVRAMQELHDVRVRLGLARA